jgi:uncharacterized membrane protein
MKFLEHPGRSLVKTVTYRLLIITSTFIVTYAVTGNLEISIGITFFTNFLNTLIYYLHERVWNLIHWGKTGK